MSIHNVKEILSYVPEALEHTKKASVEKELPTNSKDSTILSALEIEYMTKIAGENVDLAVKERVKKASHLYGVDDKVKELCSLLTTRSLEKKASSTKDYSEEVKLAEDVIHAMTAGLVDLEKVAAKSEELYDEYRGVVTSDLVKLYAGAGVLNKEAAELALAIRYQKTGKEEFMKIAKVIHSSDVSKLSEEENRLIAHAVLGLEKEAQLPNMNFYKDAFMVKAASVSSSTTATLAGQKVSISRIMAVAPSLANVIGADVAKELSEGGPAEVKAVAESLPLDLQKLLSTYA